ncbi:hypothetical protein TRSC58_07543 [Trypanosoma rangeli SC58]|uniref:Spastin/Vps4 C-terminal domain-containing protein n=1 Tax=Trypanosoma rangeli SC58 TaxID=429131 RepID=A0A061ISM2_TRYRA|nr:hypothetical protein TRSC58_07543 [Trypanosoma rangeli SC58]
MMFAVESMLEHIVAEKDGNVPAAAAKDAEETPRLVVQMRDFVRARDQLKPSVSKSDLRRYESLQSKFTTW